ncbi:glucoamylase [Meredithblackwellia eburnea MCA 4105]
MRVSLLSLAILISGIGSFATPLNSNKDTRATNAETLQHAFEVPMSTASKPAKKPLKLKEWINLQKKFALKSILKNIGPDPASHGAAAGVVIASPSTESPNYLYTWTRDSGLVMKALLEHLIYSEDKVIGKILSDYVEVQKILQKAPNPSGDFTTGGLGEPKFNIDLTAFTDSWGRPQRDGPALRATTLIGIGNYLLDGKKNFGSSKPNMTFFNETLIPMIKADLDYIVTGWNETTFDLWEEVSGSSFFATAVQHRALVEAVTLFTKLKLPAGVYNQTSINVLCFLQDYWSDDLGYVVSNINLKANKNRSGLDAASVLASIHTFDAKAIDCDPTTFQPCSDRALANLKAFVDSFRTIYPLNVGLATTAPVAVGRYPEDVYYAGNPWYLTTLAVAEQLYYALHTWEKAGMLNVTSTSLFFFQDLYPTAAVGIYTKKTKAYHMILSAVWEYADGFFEIVRAYTPLNGMLWEQFEKAEGTPASASNLTWSYGSFLTASAARSGIMPPAWYSPLAASICNPGIPTNLTVLVTFHQIATTYYGESIWIVGASDELGAWNPDKAIVLSAAEYTSPHPLWVVELLFPASSTIEYKFIRKEADGSIIWEDGENRVLTTNTAGSRQFISSSWK